MAFRFRRTVRIAPGLHLNLSRSGVSTTLGTRGASINLGHRGAFFTLGLPGTGLSYRGQLRAAAARNGSSEAGPAAEEARIRAANKKLALDHIRRKLRDHQPFRNNLSE